MIAQHRKACALVRFVISYNLYVTVKVSKSIGQRIYNDSLSEYGMTFGAIVLIAAQINRMGNF